MQVAFSQSFFCVWNRMALRNLRTVVLPRDFFLILLRLFDGLPESVRLCIDSFESRFDFFVDSTEKQEVISFSLYGSKSYASEILDDS